MRGQQGMTRLPPSTRGCDSHDVVQQQCHAELAPSAGTSNLACRCHTLALPFAGATCEPQSPWHRAIASRRTFASSIVVPGTVVSAMPLVCIDRHRLVLHGGHACTTERTGPAPPQGRALLTDSSLKTRKVKIRAEPSAR